MPNDGGGSGPAPSAGQLVVSYGAIQAAQRNAASTASGAAAILSLVGRVGSEELYAERLDESLSELHTFVTTALQELEHRASVLSTWLGTSETAYRYVDENTLMRAVPYDPGNPASTLSQPDPGDGSDPGIWGEPGPVGGVPDPFVPPRQGGSLPPYTGIPRNGAPPGVPDPWPHASPTPQPGDPHPAPTSGAAPVPHPVPGPAAVAAPPQPARPAQPTQPVHATVSPAAPTAPHPVPAPSPETQPTPEVS